MVLSNRDVPPLYQGRRTTPRAGDRGGRSAKRIQLRAPVSPALL